MSPAASDGDVPPRLAESAADDPDVRQWLTLLPAARAEAVARWDLRLSAPFVPGGSTAWVAPARTRDGVPVVLKVGMRHPEAEHEAAGLRVWDGHGAVRLLHDHVDQASTCLLLERCTPGTTLADRPEPVQDEVITALLCRAWQAPVPYGVFRPLADLNRQIADEAEYALGSEAGAAIEPSDASITRTAIAMLRETPGPRPEDVLLCTDLHHENVLAAEREPWLFIDPKPYLGDRAYDLTQHLLNCEQRLGADPHRLIGRISRLADVDASAVARWLFLRLATEQVAGGRLRGLARVLAP